LYSANFGKTDNLLPVGL